LSLMERAGWAVAEECHRLCGNPSTPILVLCGRGNNGGDGWVAARHLLGWGYRPKVLVSHPPEDLSPDSVINWKRYKACPSGEWKVWDSEKGTGWFEEKPVVLDALLGTGISGKPRSPYSHLIGLANESAGWILGVDVPSGVNADTGEVVDGVAARCRSTVTFGLPKRGHVLLDGLDRTGALTVADIGFPEDLVDSAESDSELITPRWALNALPRFPLSAHKGLRGKILIVAGSPRLLGAALLAARAALAAGAGLVTLALPESLNGFAKCAVPEAMTLPVPETASGCLARGGRESILEFSENMEACALGPGLGTDPETRDWVVDFLRECRKPVVVDADGLNALCGANRRSVLKDRRAPTVLTPHPGEMARLMELSGPGEVEANRWETARQGSREMKATLLLKGAATVVATEGHSLLVNRTGHPAMAQGGMGDALTGVAVALLGQGIPPHLAAGLAAYLHGRAGECEADENGSFSVTAGGLTSQLGKAVRDLATLGDSRWLRIS